MLILEENAKNMLLLSTLNLVKTHNTKKQVNSKYVNFICI